MIKVVGFKRLIIFVVLLSVNLILGAAIYLYVLPEQETAEGDLRSISSQTRAKQADISRMQLEFKQLDELQNRFDNLKADGFFSTQIRSEAKEVLSVIQRKSNVISATVSVKPGQIENSVDAQKSGHQVLMSPVEVRVEAFDDSDVYRYIEVANDMFPGHLRVDGVNMRRSRDVSAAVLRAISSGASPPLVSATIKMSWRTMIPESQVLQNESDNKRKR